MDKAKAKMLRQIIASIKDELRGNCADGIGFTSALINTLDTVREHDADEITYQGGLLQKDREPLALQFILDHYNPMD